MIKHTVLKSLFCRRVSSKISSRSGASEYDTVRTAVVNVARQFSSFEDEIEELKVQQIPDQDIPVPSDSTVHEVMSFFIQGYDCTAVEHFAQYAHNLAKNMDLRIFDSFAMPTKQTLVHTIQTPGTSEKLKPRDFTLPSHRRVIQLQELQGTMAPIFLEMLQVNLPEGVSLNVEPHSQYHHKERFIQKEIPKDLL
ncbi:39S ribosomal protein L48, mitochondrial-like [Acanthaster planci]|uniref:39S ribosomal protein L48, mitochondrial-like n=1 Tax=Acanthaster planci TaxID=133434 RepID=A0A8B7Y728_ACAPL|nr:39S ribosomal protein L48, mitochondrial-like [Acanthaster planci]